MIGLGQMPQLRLGTLPKTRGSIPGKEEEARVHQHMHAVAQRQVRANVEKLGTVDTRG